MEESIKPRVFEGQAVSIISQLSTSGIIGNTITSALVTGDITGLNLLLGIGIPGIGVLISTLKDFKSSAKQQIIVNEIKKLESVIDSVNNIMNQNEIKSMSYLLQTDISANRYELVKTLLENALRAKNEAIRDFCSSMIVYAGSREIDEAVELDKMYLCLEIIKELNTLDLKILRTVELYLTIHEGLDRKHELEIIQKEILDDKSISVQEIHISKSKLYRLGLIQSPGTGWKPYEDQTTKSNILHDVPTQQQIDRFTPIFLIFKKYVAELLE